MPADDVVLCRYHYDPLDRLVGHLPAGADSVQRFYQKNRLTTEIQGLVQRSIVQTEDQLLAQHEGGNCILFATDQQRSVLHELTATQQRSVAYMPYGFRSQQLDLPGFNGEQPDPVTGHYLLGNGYRAFNPVLMRFNSPDSLSPFGAGGLNAYAYCVGDPVNRVDPSGHTPPFIKKALRRLKIMRSSRPTTSNIPPRRPATNIRIIDEGVYSFEETLNRDSHRLTIDAHARSSPEHGYHGVASGNKTLTPDHLDHLLQKSGVTYHNYDKVRLMICNSATGGPNSFAAEFSALTGKPVQGFRSKVFAEESPGYIPGLIAQKSDKIRSLSNGLYHYEPGIRVGKTNPYSHNDPLYLKFNHMPVTYENTRL